MTGRPIRVLVVDDSAPVRELLVSILHTDPAIRVIGEASNGAEAVKKAVESHLGVGMVSRHAISRELALGALCRVPVDGLEIHRPIQLLHRKGKQLTPLARRFLAFAAEHAAASEHKKTSRRALRSLI
jgi:DNA-binding transcriptional LysR family regulator